MVAIPSLGCNVTYTILLEHTWYNIGKVRIRITYYSKQTVFIKLLVRQTFSYYVSSHYVDKNEDTLIYMIFFILYFCGMLESPKLANSSKMHRSRYSTNFQHARNQYVKSLKGKY